MSAVLVALLVVAASLLLLLAVPVDIAFRCRGTDVLEGQLTLRWLFGLVRVSLPRPDAAASRQAASASRAARRGGRREGREGRGPRAGRGRAMAALRRADFRRRLWRLARDLLHAARWQELILHLRLGLGDPADTGRLWALLGPLGAAAQGLRHAQVRIEPEFTDAVLELDAQGRLVLVPLQWLALALGFAVSPPSLRAWRAMRTAHG